MPTRYPRPAGVPCSRRTLSPDLPDNPSEWPAARLRAELVLALAARRRIEAYKGGQWKAEFMRRLYPECRSASAKGFSDLIKRLTAGPWSAGDLCESDAIRELMEDLVR